MVLPKISMVTGTRNIFSLIFLLSDKITGVMWGWSGEKSEIIIFLRNIVQWYCIPIKSKMNVSLSWWL